MSPRTNMQLEKLKESKRLLIMDAALELFANEGYYKTTIGMIAKKAAISKGLMYSYFLSKEDLIKSIVLVGIHDIIEIFDPDKDGVLTTEEFKFMIDGIFRMISENIRFWRLYFAIVVQPQVLKLVSDELFDFMGMFNILEDYFRKKGFEYPKTEAKLFHALMDGVCMNYVFNPGLFPLDEIKQLIMKRYF